MRLIWHICKECGNRVGIIVEAEAYCGRHIKPVTLVVDVEAEAQLRQLKTLRGELRGGTKSYQCGCKQRVGRFFFCEKHSKMDRSELDSRWPKYPAWEWPNYVDDLVKTLGIE